MQQVQLVMQACCCRWTWVATEEGGLILMHAG